MLTTTETEEVKSTVREFFKKMTIEAEIGISFKEETVVIDLKTEEPQILIGERGQALVEIQQLLKTILRKKIVEPFFVDLDINDYKKKKTEYLKEMARSAADEVALTKKEKGLPPMPAYERRIIHLELSSRNDVATESVGEEPDRRVVIKLR